MEHNHNAKKQRQKCEQCRTTLRLGTDTLAIQHGVIGPRGFVPLDDPTLVCSERCLRDNFKDIPKGPERPP